VSEDKARVERRKAELGEEGLAKKAKELEEAQEENDRPIPDNMITDFPISDVSRNCSQTTIIC
jgi:Zn-dependent M16 (insulinase) family peptidase